MRQTARADGAANVVIVCDPCNIDRGAWSLPAFLAALEAEGDPRAAHVAAFLRRAH
jgi:hypothetical protein